MTLVEHPSAAERTAARFAATTPKGSGIKPKVLRPHPECPSEPGPAVSTVHRLNPRKIGSIEPVRRQAAPMIVLAIYLCAKKLYRAIYRRKALLSPFWRLALYADKGIS